jgi:hypothetical protein
LLCSFYFPNLTPVRSRRETIVNKTEEEKFNELLSHTVNPIKTPAIMAGSCVPPFCSRHTQNSALDDRGVQVVILWPAQVIAAFDTYKSLRLSGERAGVVSQG